jgi:hypothetical protein
MTDMKMEPRWGTAPPKPKDLTVSDMIHNYLVRRTMARHGFTEEQALALILAFGG